MFNTQKFKETLESRQLLSLSIVPWPPKDDISSFLEGNLFGHIVIPAIGRARSWDEVLFILHAHKMYYDNSREPVVLKQSDFSFLVIPILSSKDFLGEEGPRMILL